MTITLPKWILPMVSFVVLVKLARGDVSDGSYRISLTRDCGDPLFLTRLLNKSNIFGARRAAMVQFPEAPEFQRVRNIQSYSGFFTVNETLGSNIFFWFFPAETNSKGSPLLLWLGGGPESASVTTVFSSCGPLEIDGSQLTPGANRWTKVMNVLYLESPIGDGFSFTKNASGYAINQNDYATDLYAALSQFFSLFPDHRPTDLFIAGISYAGKYVSALAYEIHKNNPTAPVKINLKGIAIGNGFLDPLIQIGYSKFLYGVNLIDSETKLQFEKIEDGIKTLIRNEEYTVASKELNEYLYNNNGSKSIMVNVTGVSSYNYLTQEEDGTQSSQISRESFRTMIAKPQFRKSIHVGSQEFWMNPSEYIDHLQANIVQSVANKLEVLMDNYRVVLYSGQLDIACNYRLMIDYVAELKWTVDEEYRNATRHQWWVDGELAGYSKTAGNFTEIFVRDAGHYAHEDKPSWVFDLLKRVSHNIPFF